MEPVPTLLALIPHPDDESYSLGGLIALAAAAGWECVVHCASSGEKGKRHDGGETHPAAVRECREAELRRSCEVLGAGAPTFWRLPDGRLAATDPSPAPVSETLRAVAPDIILTLGRDGAYGHPDHLALHRWVTEAWRAFPRPRPALLHPVFPKGLFVPQWEKCRHMLGDPPDPPAEALGGGEWHYEVPVAAVSGTKLASIAAHRSQLPDGGPESLFPEGIVRTLLDVERFEDASGRRDETVAGLLASLTREHSA